jgi:hypothetical protein
MDFFSEEAGSWLRLDTQTNVVPPDTRLSAYTGRGSRFGFDVAGDAYSAGYRVHIPPPPPPSSPPATIHRTDTYRIVIFGTRADNPMAVQLQEVRFYGDSSLLDIITAINPGGCQPRGVAGLIQSASNLIDANIVAKESKWLDLHMAMPKSCPEMCSECRGTSELFLILRSAARLRSYDMVTANDNPHRDPVSWRLYHSTGTNWTIIDAKSNVPAPLQRVPPYPRMYIVGVDEAVAGSEPFSSQPYSSSPTSPPPPLTVSPPTPPPFAESPELVAPPSPIFPLAMPPSPILPLALTSSPTAPLSPMAPSGDVLTQPNRQSTGMNPAIFWPILGGCIAALLIVTTCYFRWHRTKSRPLRKAGSAVAVQAHRAERKAGTVSKAAPVTAVRTCLEGPTLITPPAPGTSAAVTRLRNPGLYGACLREGEATDMTHVRARVSRAREVNAALDLSDRRSSLTCGEGIGSEGSESGDAHATLEPTFTNASARPAACIRISESRLSTPGRSRLSFSRKSHEFLSKGFGKQWLELRQRQAVAFLSAKVQA